MDRDRLRETVGKNICRIRTEKNISQAELGARCNRKEGDSAKNYISLVERAGRNIDIRLAQLMEICEFLDISPADLLAGFEYKGSPASTMFCENDKEEELLSLFRSMNDNGKEKIIEYINDLDRNKYQKTKS